MAGPDRDQVIGLLGSLSQTCLRDQAILAGSAGLYAVSADLPALTEDADLIVDAEWLAANETAVLEDLGSLGFSHEAGTSTFVGADGSSVDLIGFSRCDRADRIGGGERVPVTVFGDLSRLLEVAGTTVEVAGVAGARALAPAAFVAAKLLTVRLEKGAKDKLQALLVVAERKAEAAFLARLRALLERFPGERIEDALSDAQAAFLSLSADAERRDPQGSGYRGWLAAVREGLTALVGIRGAPRGAAS